MTREEILKLKPGPELNRLMAEKVMGWKRTTEGAPPGCAYWKDDDGFVRANETPDGSLNWNPSTDIAAAWEVVRRVFELKPMLSLVLFTDISGRCRAAFYDILEHIDQIVPVSEIDDAETVPLALSRAALLAVMEVDNDS